jgi:beta-glucosidase
MFRFPRSFLFGTATAATQIEGGCTTSDWFAFARQPGRVKNGDKPDVACDAWHLWESDVELQRTMGLGAYRMSIEWARIEPLPGEIDRSALDTYRRMLGALRDAGIEPMVTLHHFTLPQWVARRGGLLAEGFPEHLARFARVASGALGDLCRLWVTINEPNVLAAHSYLLGVWPPARKNPIDAVRAHHRLLEAHVAGYRALKEHRAQDLQVGLAHHLRVVEPRHPSSRADRAACAAFERVFNDAFALAVCTGKMYGPLDPFARGKRGFKVADARGTQDFFGINYYSRDIVGFSPRHPAELFVRRSVPAGAELSDLGWEVYPEGLGRLVRAWSKRSSVPVYITENGIADAKDEKRASFTVRHLAELGRAIADGVDVRGYFHWSLLDNFEWAEGYAPRFGLVAVDYATQERRVRDSARVYERIARTRAFA